jgi:hypothetical protein
MAWQSSSFMIILSRCFLGSAIMDAGARVCDGISRVGVGKFEQRPYALSSRSWRCLSPATLYNRSCWHLLFSQIHRYENHSVSILLRLWGLLRISSELK